MSFSRLTTFLGIYIERKKNDNNGFLSYHHISKKNILYIHSIFLCEIVRKYTFLLIDNIFSSHKISHKHLTKNIKNVRIERQQLHKPICLIIV